MTPSLKYKELPDGRTVLDVETGDRFVALLQNVTPLRCEGRIYVSKEHEVLLCQNEADGWHAFNMDLQGYNHSWIIQGGTEEEMKKCGVFELQILPPEEGDVRLSSGMASVREDTVHVKGVTLTHDDVEKIYQEILTRKS